MTTDTAPAPAAVPLSHRLADFIDAGYHPATGQPLLATETCGGCKHHNARLRADGRTKCELAGRRGGPNLPPHTPACVLHVPIDEGGTCRLVTVPSGETVRVHADAPMTAEAADALGQLVDVVREQMRTGEL